MKLLRAIKTLIVVTVLVIMVFLLVYDYFIPTYDPLLIYPDVRASGSVVVFCDLVLCPSTYIQSVTFTEDTGQMFVQNISSPQYSVLLPNYHDYAVHVSYIVNFGYGGNTSWTVHVGNLDLNVLTHAESYDIRFLV